MLRSQNLAKLERQRSGIRIDGSEENAPKKFKHARSR
jgi:hypothetical protein